MDTNDPVKNICRKVLSECNMDKTKTRVRGNLKYLDVRNRTKLVSPQNQQNVNRSSLDNMKNKRSRKVVAQKENIQGNEIKTSSALKTLVLRKKGDSSYVCEPTGEGKAFKRRILQMPQNHSSPEIRGTDLVKAEPVMEMAKDKNPVSIDTNKNLPTDLTDLILKPTKDKICRPPNAFMLFAKKRRSSLGVEEPSMSNGDRSYLLGSMWRGLSDEEKEKYYRDADELKKLHKETYPDYMYSPREARKQKQIRSQINQILKENRLQPRKGNTAKPSTTSPGRCTRKMKVQAHEPNEPKVPQSNIDDVKCDYSCSPIKANEIGGENTTDNSKKALLLRLTKCSSVINSGEGSGLDSKSQEISPKTIQRKDDNIKRDKIYEIPRQPLGERFENLSNNPFHSTLYYPTGHEQRIPITEYSAPCNYCPLHGTSRRYIEHSHSSLMPTGNSHSPLNTTHESFPAIHNPFFQPFHPSFNNHFHPAVWNPWMMWPGPYYNPAAGPDFHKDWTKFGPSSAHFQKTVPKRPNMPEDVPITTKHPTVSPFSRPMQDQSFNARKDQRPTGMVKKPNMNLKKQILEKPNEMEIGPTAKDQPTTNPFSTPLNNQLSSALKVQNIAENEVAANIGCSKAGSDSDEFRPLFIDEGTEDESFCDENMK